MRVSRIVFLVITILSGLLVVQSPAIAGGHRTIVVDDDHRQCPRAEYTQIQPAIDAAGRGDTIRVCSGSYVGGIDVNKSVTLAAQTPAAPGVDCPGGGAVGAWASVITGAVTMSATATGGRFDGFVVTGAGTGITSSAEGSGYQLRRNIIQGNGDFGLDLRSAGGQTTVVERNCIRGNGVNGTQGVQAGIVGDFGNLRDTVIRDNTFVDNVEAISVSGSFGYSNITITKNVIRRETIVVAGLVAGEITRNDIDNLSATPPRQGILIGGDNAGLIITSNSIAAAGAGIFFCQSCTNDAHPRPNVGLLISANTIREDVGSGISMSTQEGVQVTRSVIHRNSIHNNGASGIFMNKGSIGNVVLANTSTGNARGIYLNGAAGTVVVGNNFSGNTLDAWDATPDQNEWIANSCATDDPAGALCIGSSTASRGVAPADTSRAAPAAAILPAPPKTDLSRWPCVRVPVWDAAGSGGAWNWTTVVAPNAPPDAICGN